MFEAPESPWRVACDGSFNRQDVNTRRPDDAPGKQARREILAGHVAELDRLQRIFYAHDRHAMLLVLQGMDAAGEDSTIRLPVRAVPAGVAASLRPAKPGRQPNEQLLLYYFHLVRPPRSRVVAGVP